MQIVLLGAGGYHPNSRRHTACVMLPEIGVVFDAGTAAFRIREHLVTDRLDLFLSHTHLDHVFGLTSLIGLFDGDDPGRITVHGQAEKLTAVREHLFAPLLFPVPPNFTFRELAPAIDVAGGGRVTWFPLAGHPGGTVGYRLDLPAVGDSAGKSMAYVTDTIVDLAAPHVERLAGLDVLIHEAYFGADDRDLATLTGHSCLPDVIDLAAKVEPKQLVLVHTNPRDDRDEPFDLAAARDRLPAVTLGSDGDVIEF